MKLAAGEQEGDDERRGEDRRGRGQRAVVRAGLGVGEEHHAERRRRELRVGDDDQRPVQVVPVRDEREHREGGDRRPGARHDDAPDDLELAHAVEARRVDDLVGIALEELAEQEDREHRQEERHHHREIGVEQAELGERDVERQRRHLHRDRERRAASARTAALRPGKRSLASA